MIAEAITNLIPPEIASEWALSHLISLDHGEWQVNLSSEDGVAIGTGDSIESAITAASTKALTGMILPRYRVGDHSSPGAKAAVEVMAGLLRPKVQGVVRRV